MASYPPFIPIAFGGAGDEVALIFTQDATGAQLALAIMRQNEAGCFDLNPLWRRFRRAGGTAEDRVGSIIRLRIV